MLTCWLSVGSGRRPTPLRRGAESSPGQVWSFLHFLQVEGVPAKPGRHPEQEVADPLITMPNVSHVSAIHVEVIESKEERDPGAG